MPSHASLGAAIESAAATQSDIRSQIFAAINALETYILAQGRSYIDTPAERTAIEAEAVKAFNALFAERLGPLATGIIDGFVASALDKLLTYLAATPTIPTVTPEPAHQPIGSAPQ